MVRWCALIRRKGYDDVREDKVVHVELRRWAHCMVVAPCSANTLAKVSATLRACVCVLFLVGGKGGRCGFYCVEDTGGAT